MKKVTTGQRIKEGLVLRGMNQADLCDRTGISSAQISSYISERYSPKPENRTRIANALRVSEMWLDGYDVDYSVIPENVNEYAAAIASWVQLYGAELVEVNEEDPSWAVVYQGVDLGDSAFPKLVEVYRQRAYLSDTEIDNKILSILGDALKKRHGFADSNLTSRRIKGVRVPVLGSIVAGMPLEAIELRDEDEWEEIHPDLASTGDFFALRVKGSSMEPKISEGDIVIVRQQPDVDNGSLAVVMINGNEATLKKVTKHENGIMLTASNVSVYEPHFYSKEEIETLPVQILGKVVELRAKFE